MVIVRGCCNFVFVFNFRAIGNIFNIVEFVVIKIGCSCIILVIKIVFVWFKLDWCSWLI